MTRIASTLTLAMTLCAATAFARTGPNVPGATPRGEWAGGPAPLTRTAAPLAQEPVTVLTIQPAPLPAGAEQIDSTYYDLQDMGSLGQRVVIDGNGTVHATYMKDFCELNGSCPPNLNAPDPYPWRSMAYAYRSGGVWTRVGKVQDPRLNCVQCVPEHTGGFGTIALTPSGRVAISEHMNEDGCERRGDMYLEDGAGLASWRGYLTHILQSPPDPSYLEFPEITANPNGSFTLLAETVRAGIYDGVAAFRTAYLAAPGQVFTCPTGWQYGSWTAMAPATIFADSVSGFPAIGVSSNGRVGVAVTDFGGNVWLVESSNGTFAAGTIVTRQLTSYTTAAITAPDSTSTQYRPYLHCSVAYNDTTPNVVWSEVQARKKNGVLTYADWHSRIMHWDSIRGVEVVKQVVAGEADRFDDVDNGLHGPLPGLNHISVDWPQVGFSSDGTETYVCWLRFTDAQVDTSAHINLPGICTGVGYGDIMASLTRSGEGWGTPQNVTNTPTTDERFFSLAPRNADGKLHLVFSASATNQAGDVILGDRGNSTSAGNLVRRIAYLERTIDGTHLSAVGDETPLVASSMLLAAPNPSVAGVRFAMPAGARPTAGQSVDVFGIDGRLIARVPADHGGAFTWNGRDQGGARVAAGVYFARIAGSAATRPVRFTLLP